jgi:uncharacterized protein (DUF608 family)
VAECHDNCGCGKPADEIGLNRRSFLTVIGGSALVARELLDLSASPRAIAGPFDAADTIDHFVPADKKLAPEWIASLLDRGQPQSYRGMDLSTIGMPVGGIAAGLVYLTGDGRLVQWDIFNELANTGFGAVNYELGRLPTETVRDSVVTAANDVLQGTAIRVRQGDSTTVRPLDAKGFPDVTFRGEYPIGRIDFADEGFPVRVELEAFSPFIPLNAPDSALPLTILNYAIENASPVPVEVTLASWLENAVMRIHGGNFADSLRHSFHVLSEGGLTGVSCGARLVEQVRPPARAPIVFADFEGEGYSGWHVEGESFGKTPATGTLPGQQRVSGFRDNQLVNSFVGGDPTVGRMVSREFKIERPWIGFLVGGGGIAGETCVNLLVDGHPVRTATGKNNEQLDAHNWDVSKLAGKSARIEIIDRAAGPWGHINIDQIEFRDDPMPLNVSAREQPDWGTMALAVVGGGSESAALAINEQFDLATVFSTPPLSGKLVETAPSSRTVAIVRQTRTLNPGERATITVLVAWSMPNLYQFGRRVGQYYNRRFRAAADVVRYAAQEYDRLVDETRCWRDTYYNSTLPHWLLDRIGATVCNLATTTCEWWRNGRFWAYEGVGCCHGTCGHVWNYAQALARLFPSLERSVREMQDFAADAGFNRETGAIAFRGEDWHQWAGDAQGGYILKAYREHLISPDDAFLDRNWGNIRRAAEFLIREDANGDGLLEGRQHNTYDIDYFGANTMVGSLYLGALRAAEVMAQIVGDTEFAQRCRRMFDAGRDNSMRRLFNGEYFVQIVDLKRHSDWQYANGCLSDQLLGQFFAHQVGLGHLYPKQAVCSALQAVWKYNWAPDIARQNEAHPPERWFARAGEAGLFTCTWPKSKHLGDRSTRYRDEVWTGIEYQVAAHLAHEGMVTEALAICRGVHDRYHPAKRNPYNEVECGDHYARALASWGMVVALSGFEYDGPRRRIGFAPRVTPADFASVFTTAEGWGRFVQRRGEREQFATIELAWGRLPLSTVVLEVPASIGELALQVRISREDVVHTYERSGERLHLQLRPDVELKAGDALQIELRS